MHNTTRTEREVVLTSLVYPSESEIDLELLIVVSEYHEDLVCPI